ncbi:MAG: hypothetical protein GEU71_18085, partial [Actinobacteria bacterium]|nr:hypothetical protein [Actinomycetota bacterium]
MRRALCGLTIAIGSILLTPGPAVAGGSWMDWEATAYAPGQVANGHGTFSHGCCNRGTEKDGPYFAYLVRAHHGEIPPLPKDAINLEPLPNVQGEPPWDVTLSFTVPDVPSGAYNVLLCNDPCTDFLGDSMGNGFTVAPSPERAEMHPVIHRLRTRLAKHIRLLRARIERLELQHRRLQSATDQRVDLLSDRVADLERVPPTEEDRSPEPGTA